MSEFSAYACNTETMTDFRPFSAWRYDPAAVKLSEVLAPPYDIISPRDQEGLYGFSPYNCVRLILNRQEPGDDENNNRYLRARAFFREWQQKGILIRDQTPSFYLYRQDFRNPKTGEPLRRTAFLGALRLEPFEKGIVVPHERTLSAPKADRKKLLRATQTNLSPVFGLFDDSGHKVLGMVPDLIASKPLFEAETQDGIRHYLWKIQDESQIRSLHHVFSQKTVYIADGHHRYQTALDYSLEVRRQNCIPTDQTVGSDFIYMALVAFQDPGHVLLPTHRIVLRFEGFRSSEMLERLKPFFVCEPMGTDAITERLEREKGGLPAFGFLPKEGGGFFLRLRDWDKAKSFMPPGKPEISYRLDVNVLGSLVFDKLWNFPESLWEKSLRFTHSDDEALKAAGDPGTAAVFLLRPPDIQVLAEMGKVKELMPQKSTYFFPKLASGLLFYDHKDGIPLD